MTLIKHFIKQARAFFLPYSSEGKLDLVLMYTFAEQYTLRNGITGALLISLSEWANDAHLTLIRYSLIGISCIFSFLFGLFLAVAIDINTDKK